MKTFLTLSRCATRGSLAGLFTLGLASQALSSTTECPARFNGKRLTHTTISDGPSTELPPVAGAWRLPYPKASGEPYYIVCNYGTTALSLPLPADANASWYTKDYRTVCGQTANPGR